MIRYFSIILLLGVTQANSQHILWQKTIGGNGSDNLYSISATADGGVICGGSSLSNISGDKTENGRGHLDFWIVKLDAMGQLNWQKTLGGNNEDVLKSIIQTTDGGYLCGGWSYSDSSGDKTQNSKGGADYWVIKLDSAGNMIWQNTLGGSNNDYLTTLSVCADGGYFAGGHSVSNTSGDKSENSRGYDDYWFAKLDSSGNLLWEKTVGGVFVDRLLKIIATADSGLVCAGRSNSVISGEKTENRVGITDYWVLKFDKLGDIQWQNTIGGLDADYLYDAVTTPDGGLICGGWSNSDNSGDKTHDCFGVVSGFGDYWIVKLDSAGNVQWDKTIGGSLDDQLNSITAVGDSGYLCAGYSWSDTSGNKTKLNKGITDFWIVYLDTAGQIKWQYDIGGTNEDYLYSLYQSPDGSIVCGGSSNSGISGDKADSCRGNLDFWVFKFDRNINTGIPAPNESINFLEVFPNPMKTTAEVKFNFPPPTENIKLQIINFTGQLVREITISENSGKVMINRGGLPAGIYLLSLSGILKRTSVKLIIN